ncbi:hypothetical protein TREMEDRAFT_71796 [Tremella mesenterica DSM 1558]|uniref:uncharacterized protein n=1 Tax=Tremella mesenterica (strain ATCC 24925 / CBS 8224 / DSM 1558 / NBRC 9311 / NRRL Y-6157 / RJB 2259-6 / UBC 559-6) TaxID=578456 RepID=UPI0003F490C5|nr:uncharacterized protein TREMEDRAFT_71796 [Tremella mesenterica DSM 1558]EIW69152.1 hypothetical protein TREMEDRAFT_71796 [Tremella mesenterica DSM 1558]
MEEPPSKRFRYTTYTEQLKQVTVDVGKRKGPSWNVEEYDSDTEDNRTPFTAELDRLSIHDLTTGYQNFHASIKPLSTTLTLILLNLQPISDNFYTFYSALKPDDDHSNSGVSSVLSLHHALFETCMAEAIPQLPQTVKHILHIGSIPQLDPSVVEKAYSSLSLILRTITSHLLKSDPASQRVLRETWTEVKLYMVPKRNKSYVRKCIAEAWSVVIRKARGDGLARLMDIMLEDDSEGLEVVWACALKGQGSNLHSRAMAVIDTLLDHAAATSNSTNKSMLMKVLTSLVHHCSSSTITPIVDAVVSRLDLPIGPSSSTTPVTSFSASSTTLLELLSVLLFTRKGKRFPESHIRPAMLKLQALVQELPSMDGEINNTEIEWRRALVSVVVGCLEVGHLQQWLSPGVQLIEKLWDVLTVHEKYAFASMLVAHKWAGVEQFLLPHIAKSALANVRTEPLPILQLLRTLATAGYLTGGLSNVQGGRWRDSLVSALQDSLDNTDITDETRAADRRIVGHVLELLPLFASTNKRTIIRLQAMISALIEAQANFSAATLRQTWLSSSPWNAAHILAKLLRCCIRLLERHGDELSPLKQFLCDQSFLPVLMEKWGWNREVLSCVATLLDRWPTEPPFITEVSERLLPNLLSSDSSLRLSTLRILKNTTSGTAEEVWELARHVESAEVTARNVRERTTHIARLGRYLQALPQVDAPDELLRAAIKYLLSQLKVNFRPIYPEVVNSLATLANMHGDLIWSTVWGELEKVQQETRSKTTDLLSETPQWINDGRAPGSTNRLDEDNEDFLCPNLQKSRVIEAAAWSTTNQDVADQQDTASQISDEVLDIPNYEAQLIAVLCACPSIAEKHTRHLVPILFSVARHSDAEITQLQLSTRQRQSRTAVYLELFAKFQNPKAAFRTDELHILYLELVSRGESKLQSLALKCLMTYKSPSLNPYHDSLQALLDDSKFRDQLAHLPLGTTSEAIEPQHRAELLPVVIRLLYGIITARRGKSSAHGAGARKQAVLTALSGCTSAELGTLVDLMLEPLSQISPPVRQRIGFLALLQDVLRYLGPQTLPHWSRLIDAVILLLRHAQTEIDGAMISEQDQGEEEEEKEEDEEEVPHSTGQVRGVRTAAIKRLVQFLRSPIDFDFSPFLPHIFAVAISPRLSKLEIENTQAPSGTLDLIAALASLPSTAPSLSRHDERTLPKAFACMTAVKVKPAVIARVFDIVESLLGDGKEENDSLEVLREQCQPLLDNIIKLLPNMSQAGDDLMRRLLNILSNLSDIVTEGPQAQQLVSLLGPMLRRSNKQVSEKSKANILNTLQKLYVLSPEFQNPQSTFFERNYELISQQLQVIFFPSSRKAVLAVMKTFGQVDTTLQKTIDLICNLNAYSSRRIEEPDFDKRLEAFAMLTDTDAELPLGSREWLPILRTVLFFIHEPEELSIRTNSSAVLRRFIDLAGSATEGPLIDSLTHIILPGLRRALKSKLELVRNEALLVISHAVQISTGLPTLTEMTPLLADGDEEANVFINIGHIQVHRRSRAVRRLRDFISESVVGENNLFHIFLPILEHIINGATDVTDHHLINESITTLGALGGHLRWSRYNGLVMRYLKAGKTKTVQQKYFIRTISALLENFTFPLAESPVVESHPQSAAVALDAAEVAEEVESDAGDLPEEITPIERVPSSKIAEAVTERLLPAISDFVASRDETDPAIRIPLALGVAKLASKLPGDLGSNEITRGLTTVSQILRSKEQDTRDIARETIGKIAVYLGPSWLVRVLQELRTALQRGPQKHVLAVTTHSILVLATTEANDRFIDLNAAVEDAVSISAEVIWGGSGEDAAAEGYKTKMREVKGATSRGLDTFQLVARLVSAAKLSSVLAPVKEIMHASQAVKTMKQVDEVLRRIALGLNANVMLSPEDILSLCYSLISGNSGYTRVKRKAQKEATAKESYRVRMKRDDREQEDFFPLNAHKFVSFGLDLFITAFRRGKFNFDEPGHLSRLAPLVNVIGNTLYSPTSSVLSLGLKAAAAITKCPLSQVDAALPVFISNIFKVLKSAGGSAESEVAQIALKTLAVILRENKTSQVTDTQLKYLVEIITPDLEDPSRQSAIFTILRSVVGRQFVIPEIYDLMERVSSIMVTSQAVQVQEMCRGLLMQFLLEFPQGPGRLKAQMTFLAKNLDYEFESGRISVMEILAAVFDKFSDQLIEQYGDMFFVALVAVITNDESEKCRLNAGALVQKLYGRFGNEHRVKTRQVLQSWLNQINNPALGLTSLLVYSLLVDIQDVDPRLVDEVASAIRPIIQSSAKDVAKAEESDDPISLSHPVPLQALTLASKLVKLPEISVTSLPWTDISYHLGFPHDQQELLEVTKKACLLFTPGKNEDGEYVVVDGKLADELAKLLWHIGKHWATTEADGTNPSMIAHEDDSDEDEGEESRGGKSKWPLAWLMSRMSYLVRQLVVTRPAAHQSMFTGDLWIPPTMAILRFFAGMYQTLSRSQSSRFLPHVLSPIHRILDDVELSTTATELDALRALATEIRDFVQTKVPASDFAKTWESLRRHTTEKREERRQARNSMAVSDPQRHALRKEKRGVMKKEAKKRKVKMFADGKMRERPSKRRS